MFDEKRFKSVLVLRGKTQADVAEALNIDASTLFRKIKRDGDFSREEINCIMKFLDIDYAETFDIFFTEKLA